MPIEQAGQGIEIGLASQGSNDLTMPTNAKSGAIFGAKLMKTAGAVTGQAVNIGAPGAGSVAAIVVGALADAVVNGINAYDTQKAIARLKQLYDQATALPNSPDKTTLVETIEYCITKRGIKFKKSVANATFIGQPGVAAYKAGKAIYKKVKGTKGVGREAAAGKLEQLAAKGAPIGPIAREVIKTIVMMDYDKIMKNVIADALKSG